MEPDLKSNYRDHDVCWSQEENLIFLNFDHHRFHWEMPEDYDLNAQHFDLLKIAEFCLLSPFLNGILDDWEPSRKHGSFPSLSFSGGIDSTAAFALMPKDTILIHHRRDFSSLLIHDGADRLFSHIEKEFGRKVYSISSNHEKLRVLFDRPTGFSTDLAAAVHIILLADYFDLKGVALGMPLDNTYLWHGHKFRNFEETHWWKMWSPLMSSIGLDLILPVAGISEASTVEIVKQMRLGSIVSSCLRKAHPGCGKCWKCFHKNGMLGHPYNIKSKEIQTFLNRRPVRTATHALWWVNEQDHWSEVPDLIHLKELDFSWWTQYYSPAFNLLPDWIKDGIQEAIESSLNPMTDESTFMSWNLFPE